MSLNFLKLCVLHYMLLPPTRVLLNRVLFVNISISVVSTWTRLLNDDVKVHLNQWTEWSNRARSEG
jgi:hypothetical protein